MKKKIWKEFELTGSIDSYLSYKSNIDSSKDYEEAYNSDVGETQTIE